MNRYAIYQKFSSVSNVRKNNPLQEPIFLGEIEAERTVAALSIAMRHFGVGSLLLKAKKVDESNSVQIVREQEQEEERD